MTFRTSFTLSCFGAAALGTMLCPSASEAQRSAEREGAPVVISPTESGTRPGRPRSRARRQRAQMTAEERERMAVELQEAFRDVVMWRSRERQMWQCCAALR